jgi:hypothetical protein
LRKLGGQWRDAPVDAFKLGDEPCRHRLHAPKMDKNRDYVCSRSDRARVQQIPAEVFRVDALGSVERGVAAFVRAWAKRSAVADIHRGVG